MSKSASGGLGGDAATDLTVGFGASSVTGPGSRVDPWSDRCFVTLCDAAINYTSLSYPLPTDDPSYNDLQSLPSLIRVLQERALIGPLSGTTAQHYSPLTVDLEQQFLRFYDWASRNAANLNDWLSLHFTIDVKQQHFLRLRHEVQHPVSQFWSTRKGDVGILIDRIGATDEELRYAFDVMYRGLQYSDMTRGRRYFNHPIRDPLLPPSALPSIHRYSFGRALLRGIAEKRIPKDLSLLGDTIAILKEGTHDPTRPCTWLASRDLDDDEVTKRLLAVSATGKLPTRVKSELRKSTAELAAAGGLGFALAGEHGVALALDSCALVLEKWSGSVPPIVAKVPVLRGVIEIPGLKEDA